MTSAIIELSEATFAARYKLRTNHLNPTAGWACGHAAGAHTSIAKMGNHALDAVPRSDAWF